MGDSELSGSESGDEQEHDFFAPRIKGVDGVGPLGVSDDALKRFVESSQHFDSGLRRFPNLDQGMHLQGAITGLEKGLAANRRRENARTFGFYVEGPDLHEECELLLERLIELADQDGCFQFVATIPSKMQATRTDAALQALEDRSFLLAVSFSESGARAGKLSDKGRLYFIEKRRRRSGRKWRTAGQVALAVIAPLVVTSLAKWLAPEGQIWARLRELWDSIVSVFGRLKG